MRRRTTAILFGLLAALLLLWLGSGWLRQRSATQLANRPLITKPDVLDGVTAIEIVRQGAGIALQRQGDRWFVTVGDARLPAEASAVEQLTNALRRATISATAAHTQDALDQFGLGADRRIELKFSANGMPVVEVALGTSTDSDLAAFITRAGDGAVYLVDGIAPADVRADFRDHQALRFTAEAATQVAVNLPRNGYTLTKGTDGQWLLDGQAANQVEAGGLVRTLSAVRVMDFPSNTATFTPSGISIEVTAASSTYALTFGPATREGGVIVKNSDGYVYTLSKDVKEHIAPARRTLLP